MIKIRFVLFFQLMSFICFAQNEQPPGLPIPNGKALIDSLMKIQLNKLPNKYIQEVEKKAARVNDEIERKSEKLIAEYRQFESEILEKLMKNDSTTIHAYLKNAENQYQEFIKNIQRPTEKFKNIFKGEYLPYLDSLKSSMGFLHELSELQGLKLDKIQSGLDQIAGVQASFEKAGDIKQFVQKQQDQLKNLLAKYSSIPKGITKRVAAINQKIFNYSSQIKAYKELFRNPEDIEQKALAALNQIPAFQKFVKKNSMLANLFPRASGAAAAGEVVGLQSREELLSMLKDKLGAKTSTVSSMVQKNVQSTQGQMDQLREKLKILGKSDGDLTMPDYKPDVQKSKPVWERFEFGINIQNTRSNYFFPQTADLGISLGYSLNEKSIIGIGVSYKIGLGENIRKVSITSEGLSLRSFIDWKIKKSYFITGGFEYNYQQVFYSIRSVIAAEDWQKSGLLGITKTFSLGSKGIKKTKIQLLWDFLSYQQVPKTQPLKFRIGYFF